LKIELRHHIPCTVATFWEMFWDDRYDELVRGASAFTRTVLSDHTEGSVRRWRVRIEPDRVLPAPVRKVLGTDKLIYEQDNELDTDRGVLHWEVIPQVLSSKISARGTLQVVEEAGGVQRLVRGEIAVKVPVVGGRIEKAIVADVERSYDNAAEACRRWLDEKGR